MTATTKTSPSSVTWEGAIKKNESFFIRSNNVLCRVDWQDIIWIHAEGNYCIIHTSNKKFAVKISLIKLCKMLSPISFARIHKSYVVHLSFVDRINLNENILFIKERGLPIGRAFKTDLLNSLTIL